jgi:hypothetical protein
MRNPIQPSPDRPIPLPDSILMDAWWTDSREDAPGRAGRLLRLVIGKSEEGSHDRRHPQYDRG